MTELNNKKRKMGIKKVQAGSALVYALVIMSATSIMLLSLMQYTVSQIKFGYSRVEKEEALQIAEAGVYYYRWYLAHETSGKTAQQIQTFWDGSPLGVSEPFQDNYEGRGAYEIEVLPPEEGSTNVIVKSTGWTNKQPNVKRVVQVRFRRPSWSEYIFLTNSFVNFGDDAEVFGKVHSNGGVRFDGLAHNVVSALPARFDDPSHGDSSLEFGVHTHKGDTDPLAPALPWDEDTIPDRPDIFMAGREFPVPEVSFNGVTTDLANIKVQAQAGNGKYFNSDGAGRRINLKTDGTFDACTVSTQNTNTHAINGYLGIVSGASGFYSGTNGSSCVTPSCCEGSSCPLIQSSKPSRGRCVSLSNYPIVDNGIIFVEDNVWVEGNINNKRLTIVGANLSGGGNQADVYIGISNANIRFAAYDCNNTLGLVAQRDVRVLNDCSDNFVVDAALLAQGGVVGINDNGFSGKDSLTFNGAIASYLQPYFVHGVSGFGVREYHFNNNLLYCPPPYFPTGTEYSIDLWEEL